MSSDNVFYAQRMSTNYVLYVQKMQELRQRREWERPLQSQLAALFEFIRQLEVEWRS